MHLDEDGCYWKWNPSAWNLTILLFPNDCLELEVLSWKCNILSEILCEISNYYGNMEICKYLSVEYRINFPQFSGTNSLYLIKKQTNLIHLFEILFRKFYFLLLKEKTIGATLFNNKVSAIIESSRKKLILRNRRSL